MRPDDDAAEYPPRHPTFLVLISHRDGSEGEENAAAPPIHVMLRGLDMGDEGVGGRGIPMLRLFPSSAWPETLERLLPR